MDFKHLGSLFSISMDKKQSGKGASKPKPQSILTCLIVIQTVDPDQ